MCLVIISLIIFQGVLQWALVTSSCCYLNRFESYSFVSLSREKQGLGDAIGSFPQASHQ